MKKIFSGTLLVVLALAIVAISMAGLFEPSYAVVDTGNQSVWCLSSGNNLGDANSNNVTTASDAQTIFRIVTGYYSFSNQTGKSCCVDVNHDGNITSVDASLAFNIAISGNSSQPCDW